MTKLLAALIGAAWLGAAGPGLAQAPTLPPQPTPGPAVVSPETPPAQATHALTADDAQAWLDGLMPYALARGDVAGAVVVIVKDGQVLLGKGYGYADVAKHQPVDPDTTMFRPGSVSKLFTWTALMQQVEQGKVDLDADINTYLDFTIPPYDGKPVTARNLLTHTPGFDETIKNLIGFDQPSVTPLDQALKRWVPPRIFPPGEVPAYSNYGAALAGYIVQRVSGQGFDEYVEQHIFAPLDMRHATFRQPLPAEFKPFMASGYDLGSGAAKPYEFIDLAPAGSSAIAGGDMARFMIAHLQNGQFNGQAILRPETARLMHDTVLTTISPALHRMALGFYEENRNGHRIIGHGGDSVYFHSDLHLFLDDGVGLFVSLNSAGKEGVTAAIRHELLRGFADRYFPGPDPQGGVIASAKADAARISGSYEVSRRSETSFFSLLNLFGAASVSADADGRISASPIKGTNGVTRKFEEVGPLLWREINGKQMLAAKAEGGGIAMWSEDSISPVEVFLPSPLYRDAAWLLPAMGASVVALLLTGLSWPAAAIVRRRYAAPYALSGWAAWSVRLTRALSLADALLIIAWLLTVTLMLKAFAVNSGMDPWIMVLHGLSIVVLPLAALTALANVATIWRTRPGWRSWFARLWSAVTLLATLVLLWVGIVYHLIGLGVDY